MQILFESKITGTTLKIYIFLNACENLKLNQNSAKCVFIVILPIFSHNNVTTAQKFISKTKVKNSQNHKWFEQKYLNNYQRQDNNVQ